MAKPFQFSMLRLFVAVTSCCLAACLFGICWRIFALRLLSRDDYGRAYLAFTAAAVCVVVAYGAIRDRAVFDTAICVAVIVVVAINVLLWLA